MRNAFATFCGALLFLFALSCRAGNGGHTRAKIFDPASVIGEIESFEAAPEADPEVVRALKDALIDALKSRDTGRMASTAPSGDAGRVTDLRLNRFSGMRLEWTYRNTGDYDRNGEVGVSDITPIAINFLADTDDGVNDDTERPIDGDGNGEIGVSDVTPIAINYLATVASYRVMTSDSADSGYRELDAVPLVPSSIGAGGLLSAQIPSPDRFLYIVPEDGQGNLGAQSNVLDLESVPDIISISPLSGTAGAEVTISADVQCNAQYYMEWQVPGGFYSNSGEPLTVTLPSSPGGQYLAVKAENESGYDLYTGTFTIVAGPAPPVISSVEPLSGEAGQVVEFTASVEGDPPLSYSWNFGGGASPDASDEDSPTVTLGAPDNYQASLTVTNDAGADTYDFELTVTPAAVNTPPVAQIQAIPQEGESPLLVFMDASASYDPDADGSIIRYEWDWEGDAVFDYDSGTLASVDHTYTEPGTFSPTVRVTDDEYAWNQAATSVVVNYPSEWRIVTVDSLFDPFAYPSLSMVDGLPAISFRKGGNLMYVRALDIYGATWDEPAVIHDNGGGFYPSLAGDLRPGITYRNVQGNLLYIRADDTQGTVWGDPVTIDAGADTGHYSSLDWVSREFWPLEYVLPGVAYYDAADGDLMFSSVIDRDGNWGEPIVVDSGGAGDTGVYPSLETVGGNPAIAYWDATNTRLMFVRCEDRSGDVWGRPDSLDNSGDAGLFPALITVNEYPAVVYWHASLQQVRYLRSLAYDGTVWAAPVAAVEPAILATRISAAIMGSTPCFAYFDLSSDAVMFARSNDANGAVWRPPQTIESGLGEDGGWPSMVAVNGVPMVAYVNAASDELKFAAYR
ncbi:MAG: PKD domain-containing protein [bacterium]|jgi:PKD repeat protein